MHLSKRQTIYLAITIILITICSYYFIIADTEDNSDHLQTLPVEQTQAEKTEKAGTILVYVTGAVEEPGLYEMTAPVTMKDAIDAAKGLLPYADVNHLNLAEAIDESRHIHVGFHFEGNVEDLLRKNNLSINEATEEELKSISGIGPKMAKKIVDYRKEHGPFTNVEDLRKVKGIGPALYKKIADKVRV